MKVLVNYYSKTKNNETLCKYLSKKVKCDIEEIVDEKSRGFFGSAFAAILNRKTKILDLKKNPENYNLVVIATPVWAGHIPPALRTYLIKNKNKFKKIAILSLTAKGENNEAMQEIEDLAGKKAVDILQLKVPEGKKRVWEKDLKIYEKDLKEFVKKIKK